MNGPGGAYFVPVARRFGDRNIHTGLFDRPIKALCFLRGSAELLNLNFFNVQVLYK